MKKHALIFLSVLLVQAVILPAAIAQEQQPKKVVLDNGMTVVLLENHNAPVVTIQAWVGAGSIREQEFAGSGISHFVEHMLFKGTERRSVGQIGQEVKEAGGETNAYTGYDKTVYYITFHSDYFDKALDILSDALMNSTFDPAEVEREREVIVKEIKMNRDDPFRRMYTDAQATAYAVHPYGSPVIGYENLFRGLTRDDLVTYYHRLYVPNNVTFIAVGDFDQEQALAKIKDAFKDFQRKSISPIVVPKEPPQEGPREHIEEFDVTVAQSMMGFHGPDLYSEDMYPMDVLAIILGGGNTSRLYLDLREQKGLVYDISAWSSTPADPGMFWISSSLEPENFEPMKQAVWEQLKKLQTGNVSPEELETARAKVLSNYLFGKETVEGQASSLGTGVVTAHDLYFDKRYVESIGRVTAEDVRRVAKKYFVEQNSVLTVLFPRGKSPSTAAGAEQEQPSERAPQIEKTVLPNGITLLLRDDPNAETVSIRSVFLGGALAETPETSGITNLMSKSMLKGTTSRSAEDIATAIESRGGSISSFSGYNSFGFEMNMLGKDVPVALDVLSDVISHPTFPEQEVEREKTAVLADIKSVNDDIFPSSIKLFRKTMFDGHPYGRLSLGEPEVVASLKPEDLKRYHTRAVDPSRMVLCIFGKMQKAQVGDLVEEHFGNLPPVESLKLIDQSPDFPSVIKKASKEMNKEQFAILVGFPGITVANPDRYPLEVLSSMMNSQGGKLFEVLRDQRGLAYSVGAFNIMGVEPGAFTLYIMTVPQKQDEALSGMLEVIEDIKKNGISPEDLERTKVELVGTHAIGLQTNSQLGMQAAFDELYGLGYNNYQNYDKDIRAVTAKDIHRVASKYFDLDRYALVTVGDVERSAK
jgi:zinc protease